MPVIDGEYQKLTKDQIARNMEDNLERVLDMTAQPGDLVTAQLNAEAQTIADNIEESLQRVYEAAYLQDADGKELDKLVDLIGLERLDATAASGTVRFSREDPPASTYTIPRGTEVQTSGNNPFTFKTTELSALKHIDGFEDSTLNGWEGDLSSVSLVATNNMTGLQALELPATSGVTISTTEKYQIGKIFEADIRPQGATVTGVQFARQDNSNYFEVEIDAGANDLRVRKVKDGSEQTKTTKNVTVNENENVHLTIEWSLYGDYRVSLFESRSKQNELSVIFFEDSGLSEREWRTGKFALKSKDSTAKTLVDEISVSGTVVNVQGQEPGIESNLAADAVSEITTGLSGVSNVTNPVPTGDETFIDTDFNPLVIGTEEETDEELRERAFDNTSIGGSATLNSLKTEIRRLDGVQSLTAFQNKTENTVDGLPPHSFELVIYGGDPIEIVNAIHYTSSIDSQDIGGAHGTETVKQIESDVMNESISYRFSRPTEVNLTITLDLVVDDTFVGKEEIRSRIVNYIGGTDVDGSSVGGIDVGEDIFVAVLERKVVDPTETGVWEVDNITIDKDGDGNNDITEVTSGADIVPISESSVAEANARDGSISINTTLR